MGEKKITVKCPHCKIQFNYYDSEFRPFCCERCKMIDLGHWFDESYSVAGEVAHKWDSDNESNEF